MRAYGITLAWIFVGVSNLLARQTLDSSSFIPNFIKLNILLEKNYPKKTYLLKILKNQINNILLILKINKKMNKKNIFLDLIRKESRFFPFEIKWKNIKIDNVLQIHTIFSFLESNYIEDHTSTFRWSRPCDPDRDS